MTDDILKFRKTCDILMKEKGYTRGSICREAGMSEPTLQKLLNDELDSFKRSGQAGMRSSTLGIIQDFNKRHMDDVTYAGVKSEVIPMGTKTGKIEFEHNNQEKERAELLKKPETKIEPEPLTAPSFMESFIEALKQIPSNVTIQISINENNK